MEGCPCQEVSARWLARSGLLWFLWMILVGGDSLFFGSEVGINRFGRGVVFIGFST